MRLTIIADDGVVGVERDFREVDLSDLDSDIHAVQWYGSEGQVEYRDDRPNLLITDMSKFQKFVGRWNAAAPPLAPAPAPPRPVSRVEVMRDQIASNPAIDAIVRLMAKKDGKTKEAVIAELEEELQ